MTRRQSRQTEELLRLVGALIRRATPRQLAIGGGLLVLALAAFGFVNWNRGPSGPVRFPGGGGSEEASDAGGLGDWEVAFTQPEIPTKKENYKGGLDERLVALMNQAQKTLDVCVYELDLVNVAEAMAAAQSRGVRVRLVTDSDTLEKARDTSGRKPETAEAFARLNAAGIPIVDDNRSAIMHSKFTIVDGQWVQTGSWNYTIGDTYRNNNNIVIVRSPALAENFTAEFEKMFDKGRFGAKKTRGVPHPALSVGDISVRNAFAPKDKVADQLVELLAKAQKSIYFMAFQFTHDEIGRTVRERAAAGVVVGGVFETTGSQTEHSEFTRMKANGLDVWTDGNPYILHHKIFIVDERVVVLGSFNFSDSADKDNDENILIIDDFEIARRYKAEYDRVLAWAKDPPRKR